MLCSLMTDGSREWTRMERGYRELLKTALRASIKIGYGRGILLSSLLEVSLWTLPGVEERVQTTNGILVSEHGIMLL